MDCKEASKLIKAKGYYNLTVWQKIAIAKSVQPLIDRMRERCAEAGRYES